MRKNPENKPLCIKHHGTTYPMGMQAYSTMLCHLAVAQTNLVKAGKDSAMPHFIAIVKELERIHGFTFEIKEENG